MIKQEDDEELENQLNRGALWAVTYGDVMSYLMITFLLLFVFNYSKGTTSSESTMAAIQKQFGGKESRQVAEAIARGAPRPPAAPGEAPPPQTTDEVPSNPVDQIFSSKGIQQIAKVELAEDRVRLSFSDAVLFDTGRAELKEDSLPQLKKLADAVRDLPNKVQIEGHSDTQPLGPHARFKSNWELSAARAFSVLYFLMKQGIPPERLSAIGYGEFQPIATNDTPEGRAQNRRIEFNILRRKA